MKSAFLAISAMALSSAAYAGTVTHLSCANVPMPEQEGYTAQIALVGTPGSEGSSAILTLPNRAKVQMKCVIPAIEPAPGAPDQFHPVAFCNDGIADGGFSLSIRTGGFAGLTEALVNAKNFAGGKTVADMLCQVKTN